MNKKHYLSGTERGKLYKTKSASQNIHLKDAGNSEYLHYHIAGFV